jgi:hypothetical protein
VAPPGNQAATEKTNINLYHPENPVYSPKVGVFKCGLRIAEFKTKNQHGASILRPGLRGGFQEMK